LTLVDQRDQLGLKAKRKLSWAGLKLRRARLALFQHFLPAGEKLQKTTSKTLMEAIEPVKAGCPC